MALILVWIGMTIGTCMFGWFVWQWWLNSKQDELQPDMSNSYNADSEF
jgi:hypothetical protein